MLLSRHCLLGAIIILAGCSQYWAKPGGTPVELGAAREACESRANAAYPPLMQDVLVSAGTPAPMVTACAPTGSSVACSTTGTGLTPPASTTLDQNIGPRRQAIQSCLAEAGWTPVRTRGEAEAITNSRR